MAEREQFILVECPVCTGLVKAPSVGRVTVCIDDDSLYAVTHLLKCPGCEQAIVSVNHAYYYGDPNGVDETTPFRVWPDPVRRLADEVPKITAQDFEEAQRCMAIGSHTAAAMLARRVLEGIASHQGAKGRTLAVKIENLKKRSVIDGRLGDWADGLRVVGNDAAHDVNSTVSREDAADVLMFAEALAEYLYTFRRRYEEFAQRRATTAPNASS